MKKIIVSILFVLLLLSACNSSKLSFSEIENVPAEVENLIDESLTLQLINEEEKGSYIVFQSNGDIKADLETNDKVVKIKFNENNPQDEQKKQNVYYLTTDSAHDTINVTINGEEKAFDLVAGF